MFCYARDEVTLFTCFFIVLIPHETCGIPMNFCSNVLLNFASIHKPNQTKLDGFWQHLATMTSMHTSITWMHWLCTMSSFFVPFTVFCRHPNFGPSSVCVGGCVCMRVSVDTVCSRKLLNDSTEFVSIMFDKQSNPKGCQQLLLWFN